MPIGRAANSPGSAMPLPISRNAVSLSTVAPPRGELLHAGQNLPRNHADQELRVFDRQVQRGERGRDVEHVVVGDGGGQRGDRRDAGRAGDAGRAVGDRVAINRRFLALLVRSAHFREDQRLMAELCVGTGEQHERHTVARDQPLRRGRDRHDGQFVVNRRLGFRPPARGNRIAQARQGDVVIDDRHSPHRVRQARCWAGRTYTSASRR